MAKVLAIDYGTRNVGLATGDSAFKIAFPRDTIPNKGHADLLGRLLSVIEELSVEIIVLGLPLAMKAEHSKNKLQKEVDLLADKLRLNGCEVVLVDERLSSFEAKSKSGRRDKVDDLAAQIILQRYFDSI